MKNLYWNNTIIFIDFVTQEDFFKQIQEEIHRKRKQQKRQKQQRIRQDQKKRRE